MEAFIGGSTVCTRITILGDVENGISPVIKDSFCQNVVADVRPVAVCHPVSPYKSQFIEKPEEIPRIQFIGDVHRGLN